jgi:hypothetical protein
MPAEATSAALVSVSSKTVGRARDLHTNEGSRIPSIVPIVTEKRNAEPISPF